MHGVLVIVGEVIVGGGGVGVAVGVLEPVKEQEHHGHAEPVLVEVSVYPGGQVHRGGRGQAEQPHWLQPPERVVVVAV